MTTPSRSTLIRVAVALLVGIAGGFYCYFSLKASGGPRPADDFTWHWLAARALIEGKDPYVVISAGGPYHLDAPYVYPLTTAMAAVPFALFLSPAAAAATWIGCGSALLAWAVTRKSYDGLLIFLSMPYLWAANSGQFSPIITAAAVIPALGFITPVKPQIGLAALAWKPSRIALYGAIAFVALSFAINPGWVREWLDTLPHRVPGIYKSPITVLGGPLLLLSIMKWRRPEGRLLLAMSLLPQNMLFYDQLLLWLIPNSRNQIMILGILSILATFVGSIGLPPGASIIDVNQRYAPAIVALVYLPCLIMVLRRPNRSDDDVEQEISSVRATEPLVGSS
ncbi:MAG: hypothetical protein ABI556_08360 [Gemmatimonadales bacterium]